MTPAMTAYIEANEPVTALQVAQALGITRQSFYGHHREGSVHITAWMRAENGHATALYAIGKGRNVSRPPAMPQQARSRAYHQRHSAIIKSRRPSKTVLRMGVWAGLMGAAA